MTRGPFGLTAAVLLAGSLLLALSTPTPARAQAARADIQDAKGESLGTAMQAAAQLLYGRDADKAAALRRGAGPLLQVTRKTLRGAFGSRG